MLIHSMVTEMYVLCVLTLGVGDLLKSGSASKKPLQPHPTSRRREMGGDN
jgi:hypothetical protein